MYACMYVCMYVVSVSYYDRYGAMQVVVQSQGSGAGDGMMVIGGGGTKKKKKKNMMASSSSSTPAGALSPFGPVADRPVMKERALDFQVGGWLGY